MFLTEFCVQKYTGGIILQVGIFLTVTPAANKKRTKNFWIFVRYLYYVFTPYITNIMVQHEGCILPILTDSDFLTNHSSMKLSSFWQFARNVYTANLDYLTKHVSL